MASLLNMHGGSLDSISYISWLKALGCICWLPLGSDGDLLDRMSGESLSLTGNGSLVWDSSAGMYVLTNSSGTASTYVAFLDNGMNKQTFPENTLTSLEIVQRISTTGNIGCSISPLSTAAGTQASFAANYNGSLTLSNWADGSHKVATVLNASIDRSYYQDGELYLTTTPHSPYLPNNWVLKGNGLCIGMLRNDSYTISVTKEKKYYIKDIYIFNKALTFEQIKQIQGYEPLPSNVRR